MRKLCYWSLPILLVVTAFAAPAKKADKTKWALNATIIEACSCPMF